ncbi:hypothetical protein CU098_000336, partial [Rhizopus stolonifer]
DVFVATGVEEDDIGSIEEEAERKEETDSEEEDDVGISEEEADRKEGTDNEEERSKPVDQLYKLYYKKKILTKKEMKAIDDANVDLYVGLSEEDEKVLKKVLKSGGVEANTDSMMIEILMEQLRLSKAGSKHSDAYKLLNILRCIIESIEDWSEADSELTSYRHCAKILDCLFCGTELKILDGEPGCLAAKEQMIVNHSLFPFSEENALSTCAVRKVDAIVVANLKKERVELSTNEWKKSCVSSTTAMKQQSKNLRTNLSILNQLNRRYNIKTKNVVAMDFIGSVGYMYSLREKEGVYVANLIEELSLPRNNKEIKHVSKTINALFKFKNHLEKLAAEATEGFEVRSSASRLKGITRSRVHHLETPCETPRVMFSPKPKRR